METALAFTSLEQIRLEKVTTRWWHLLIGNNVAVFRHKKRPDLVTTRWWHLLIGNTVLCAQTAFPRWVGHHSLVAPIDWKRDSGLVLVDQQTINVTTRWWHLLIGNRKKESFCPPVAP